MLPRSFRYGFFVYMGMVSLNGNHLYERLKLLFTQAEMYPATHYVRRVPLRVLHSFTLVQARARACVRAAEPVSVVCVGSQPVRLAACCFE